jgi:alcohol dehydrogenase
VLGHEAIGTVVAAGTNAGIQEGARVTWSVAASCGRCFFCSHELPQKCERLFKYGHEKIRDEHPLSGGLATHCHLARGTTVVEIPTDLPDKVACPANCATATVAAALRAAGDIPGAVVLVLGAGMLGLTAAAMCRTRGARDVIVSEPDAKRRTLATDFGATAAVDPGELEELLEERTDGRGADLALEVSGAASAVGDSFERIRIGGTAVLVGSVFPAPPMPLEAEWIVRRNLTLRGIHNYAPVDLREAVGFLAAYHSKFPFAELVGRTFPLKRTEDAFRYAIDKNPPRVGITDISPSR